MAANASNRFRPGRYMVPAPTADEWSKFSDFEKDQKRGQEWLKRSHTWEVNEKPFHKWVGDKVLGKGCAVLKKGFYSGSHYGYKRIVVKQASSPQAKASLQNGAYISKCLGEEAPNRIPEHIVTPSKDYIEDAGTGTDDTFDPVYVHEFAPDTVARIYTPYYGGGNFQQWLDENFSLEYPSEDDVWSVMECLARICMNLEYGNETHSFRADEKVFQPIVHLDIRPQSIFCSRSDMVKDGQHAIRVKFSLGKFEKAAHVPPDPADKKWMFRVRGRADPKWAAPEQKYPQMEGRSISSPCNVFGIGALLYYMIKGKEIDDRAWRIGMPGSASNPEVKLCFGADLITEPVSEQQEYSKALIRVILECLAYLPSDRITAAKLQEVSSKATERSSRALFKNETQYNPGDPATIFQPQEELQPNDYNVEDLGLRDKIPMYNPPKDHPETLRARAEKWLSSFWLFPDSAKSQEARDKQREVYEREVKKQREEAAAAEAKKQARIKALAVINADIRRAEEEEEAARIKLVQARADAAQRIAELEREGEEQILLPQPNNKRDRSPEPPQQNENKRICIDPLNVTKGGDSPATGISKSIINPPENPPVPTIPASKEPGVSKQAGPAPLPKPPVVSGSTAKAKTVSAPEPPTTSSDIIPSGLAPSIPESLGRSPLSKPPITAGTTAPAKPNPSNRDAEERRKRDEESDRKEAERVREEEENARWAKERMRLQKEREDREALERSAKIDERRQREEMESFQKFWALEDAKRAQEEEEEEDEEEEEEKASKILKPPLRGASRSLAINVDEPSMRRRRSSSPEPPGRSVASPIQLSDDEENDYVRGEGFMGAGFMGGG